MCYLQTILKRHKSELIRRVYFAMKNKPVKGDWIKLVERDFESINETIDEDQIENQTEKEYKKKIKDKVRQSAFRNFNEIKLNHSKVKNVEYENLNKPQGYITSNLLNNKQTSMIVNLRSRCLQGFRKNFGTMYADQNCPLCGTEPDTQEHALNCHTVKQHMTIGEVKYNLDFV